MLSYKLLLDKLVNIFYIILIMWCHHHIINTIEMSWYFFEITIRLLIAIYDDDKHYDFSMIIVFIRFSSYFW